MSWALGGYDGGLIQFRSEVGLVMTVLQDISCLIKRVIMRFYQNLANHMGSEYLREGNVSEP
jgi:hypothetical protein